MLFLCLGVVKHSFIHYKIWYIFELTFYLFQGVIFHSPINKRMVGGDLMCIQLITFMFWRIDFSLAFSRMCSINKTKRNTNKSN